MSGQRDQMSGRRVAVELLRLPVPIPSPLRFRVPPLGGPLGGPPLGGPPSPPLLLILNITPRPCQGPTTEGSVHPSPQLPHNNTPGATKWGPGGANQGLGMG
eukprot:1143054-Prorocentrum_minimum.AAC.2